METTKKEKLIIDNLNLVDHLLQKKMHIYPFYQHYEDCQQEGRYGLILAAYRFDESKGFQFSTYATSYIEGYVRRYLRDFLYQRVKISRKLLDLIHKTNELVRRGYESGDILRELEITPLEYGELIAIQTIGSLSDTVSSEDESLTIADMIGTDVDYIEEIFGESEIFRLIDRVASTLTKDRYKDLWYEYAYTNYYGEKVTTQSLAKKYGISQPHSSRIIKACRQKLDKYLQEGK